MKYLLDTHTFIWAIADSKKLSEKATKIIEDTHNDVSVSVVTFWELSIKQSIGKLSLGKLSPEDFIKLAKESEISISELSAQIAATSYQLPWVGNHKDPFDRLLIWKAIKNGYSLISEDSEFEPYVEFGLKILW